MLILMLLEQGQEQEQEQHILVGHWNNDSNAGDNECHCFASTFCWMEDANSIVGLFEHSHTSDKCIMIRAIMNTSADMETQDIGIW